MTGIYVQPMLPFACGHCGHLVFFENTRELFGDERDDRPPNTASPSRGHAR
jgi:hypothetical protein